MKSELISTKKKYEEAMDLLERFEKVTSKIKLPFTLEYRSLFNELINTRTQYHIMKKRSEDQTPLLVNDIEELLAEHERMRVQIIAIKKYLVGEPSDPPEPGREKKPL